MPSKMRQLQELLQALEQRSRAAEVVSTNTPLDRLLPGGGLRRGTLIEWLEAEPGSGAACLALAAAQAICGSAGRLVVLDRDQSFYPPAAASRFSMQHLIVVRPANDRDESWALDQALRCAGVAAVLAWPRRLAGHTFRRLQLAAEQGGGVGLLIRPAAARQEPSWAQVRLLVAGRGVGERAGPVDAGSAEWRLSVELLRGRGRWDRRAIELEIDQQTGEVRDAHRGPLAAQLACATLAAHQARA